MLPPPRLTPAGRVLVQLPAGGTVRTYGCTLERCACGPNGEVVDVIRYKDKLGHDRRCYRLTRHGVFVGEYKTPEELRKVVDLAELVEDDGNE